MSPMVAVPGGPPNRRHQVTPFACAVGVAHVHWLASGRPMTADEQLLYEARVRPRQAVIAGVAAAGLLGASVTQLVGPHSKVNELTIGLITEHKRMGLDLAGAAFQALGSLTVAWTLVFLFGATKARNPKLPSFL